MADLTGVNADRGQLILIAGFALAVTLVALALVMNAAIYTENLATRSESVDTSNAHAYQRATENAARNAFHYAHDVNNGSNSELEKNVTNAIEAYDAMTARQEARDGRIVNVSVVNTTAGTNITGGDGGNFNNANDADQWDLAGDVSRTRQFTISVNATELASPAEEEFQVIARSTLDSQEWVLNATYNDTANEVTVGINDSGAYDSCTFSESSDFWVNVTDETIADGSCDDLNWGDRPDTYTLRYENASNVQGRYSLIVDTEVNRTNYNSSTGPYARDHLYSMTIDVVYRTDQLDYRSDIRIAPGEEDV